MSLTRFMRKKGVASSLALLASIMILTAQICINLAFTDAVCEEVLKKVREVIEDEKRNHWNVVVVVNESSLIAINRQEKDVVVDSLLLYYPSGDVKSVELKWCIPKKAVSLYQVPCDLKGCIAVVLVLDEGIELTVPVYRA